MKKLNNWWITGIVDGEGSFIVELKEKDDKGSKIGISFEIAMNYKDKFLLENLKYTLNAGNIYYNTSDNTYKFKVSNLNEINNIIIPQFKKYKLLTQKRADFEIFTKIVEIINAKNHLTEEGMQNIVKLKNILNLGLSDKFKQLYPNIDKKPKYEITYKDIPDPQWLSGFSEGESCFYVKIIKLPKKGSYPQVNFIITQHYRDLGLLKGIKDYLKCGKVNIRKYKKACDFVVRSIKDINKIITFFNKYPLQGSKLLNYEDFKKVAEIITSKEHLTKEGLEKIEKIKSGMNTRRK